MSAEAVCDSKKKLELWHNETVSDVNMMFDVIIPDERSIFKE